MNVIEVTTEDMNNGPGLRVVLWVAGCEHHCRGCHNKFTWDVKSGKVDKKVAINKVITELSNDYIDGITYSGGDPLHPSNIVEIVLIAEYIKLVMPEKSQWLYTGYTFEQIKHKAKSNVLFERLLNSIDVICDGKFNKKLYDSNLKWVGSSNQRVINVIKSLVNNKIVLIK